MDEAAIETEIRKLKEEEEARMYALQRELRKRSSRLRR